jgi:hypothetical protein
VLYEDADDDDAMEAVWEGMCQTAGYEEAAHMAAAAVTEGKAR